MLIRREFFIDMVKGALGYFGLKLFRENVNTQKLLSTTDARVWAKEFSKISGIKDEGLLIGWFANAIMVGHDEGYRKAKRGEVEIIEIGKGFTYTHIDGHTITGNVIVKE